MIESIEVTWNSAPGGRDLDWDAWAENPRDCNALCWLGPIPARDQTLGGFQPCVCAVLFRDSKPKANSSARQAKNTDLEKNRKCGIFRKNDFSEHREKR